MITDSPEARLCGLESNPKDRIRVGTEEYFDSFQAGLTRLVAQVPPERILLNRVLWATHTTMGDPLPNQQYIQRHNVVLQTAYGWVDALGIRSIEYDPRLFVTDPGHKWGVSPFHYGVELYHEMVAALARLTS